MSLEEFSLNTQQTFGQLVLIGAAVWCVVVAARWLWSLVTGSKRRN